MVNLNEKTIEAIKKIADAVKETSFEINNFEVGESGINKIIINLDIREK